MSEVGGASYRAAVADYLRSEAGTGTSQEAASRLGRLDPWALGMDDEPNQAQLHATRLFLESVVAKSKR